MGEQPRLRVTKALYDGDGTVVAFVEAKFWAGLGAQVQIDHVFASRGFHEEIQTKALNEVADWGPSDHCRIAIDVGSTPSWYL